MKKYINAHGKECFSDVTEDATFTEDDFHKPEYQPEDGEQFAIHTNLGSLTVLDRMTGFGHRDIESGFRDPDGKFWLASGGVDIRYCDCATVGEAIAFVKKRANTCIGI